MTNMLRPAFDAAGATLPAHVRVSCGWTSQRALSAKSRRIGECWPSQSSADQAREIFISPCLGDAAQASAVLVHELVHAALDCQGGHGPQFRKLAVKLGLEGKMTATVAGEDLTKRLNALVAEIGPYPHATLDRSMRPKQSTRMIKVVCPDCGYTVRTTRQWIEQGLPTCACGAEMELPEGDE
jgi:hypothetical protein